MNVIRRPSSHIVGAARHLIYRPDVNAIDVLLVLLMSWWAAWMLIPTSSIIESPSYDALWNIANNYVWGIALLALCACKVYAVLSCRWILRLALLGLQVMWWALVSAVAFSVNPNSPGWGLLGIVALTACWRAIQVAATGDALNGACEINSQEE